MSWCVFFAKIPGKQSRRRCRREEKRKRKEKKDLSPPRNEFSRPGKIRSSLTIRSIIIEGLWRDSNRWMSSTVTSTRPAPSRLPISSLSFIGFRYLFSFREFMPKPEWLTISRSMEIGRTSVRERIDASNDLAVDCKNFLNRTLYNSV